MSFSQLLLLFSLSPVHHPATVCTSLCRRQKVQPVTVKYSHHKACLWVGELFFRLFLLSPQAQALLPAAALCRVLVPVGNQFSWGMCFLIFYMLAKVLCKQNYAFFVDLLELGKKPEMFVCVYEKQCFVGFKNRYFISLTNSKGNLLYFCPCSPCPEIHPICDSFV